MEIKKEVFVDAINNIEKQYTSERNFSTAVNNYFCDDVANSLPRNYVIDSLVKILQQHFNDETKYSWIEYYLWDLDFGRNKSSAITVNNKKFVLNNPESLYDLLKNEMVANSI